MANGDNKTSLEEIKERIALLDTEVSLSKELLTSTERSVELKKNAVTEAKANIQAEQERLALLREQGELTEKQAKTHKETLNELTKELVLQEKNLKNLKESVKAGDALSSSMGNYFGILTGIDDTYKNTLLGSMLDAVTSTEGMQHAMENTIKAAKAFPKMALGTLFAQIEQSSVDVFTTMIGLNAELAKASGIGGKNFVTTIQENQRALSDWGVDIKDSGEALRSLYTQFSGFRSLSESSQGTLQKAISQFTAIGVNADAATNFMDGLTKTFGMTIPQAEKLTNQFIGLAGEVKFTAEELMSSFGQLNKDLAAFGRSAPEIFKKLVKQSDALGISLDNITRVTSQFDTFDGAAEAVGKLNTALKGNYVNMEQIMRADPAERFNIIRDAVDRAGVSFEGMNQHQARFLAGAAGFDNVEDAMKAFGDIVVEEDKSLEKYGLSQEKMKQLAKDSAGPMKLLSASMQQLAIDMAPVVQAITDAVHWLSTFIKENYEYIQIGAMVTGGLMVLWKVLKGIAAIKTVFSVIRGAGAAATIMAENKALFIKGKILTALTPVATNASAAMAGLTASAWPLSLAVIAVSAAVVAVVYMITELVKSTIEAGAPISDLATGVMGLAVAIGVLGAVAKFAWIGLGILALGLGAVAIAWKVMQPSMQALATISKNMVEIGSQDPFANWTTGIKAFANQVDTSTTKLNKLVPVLNALSLANLGSFLGGNEATTKMFTSIAQIDDSSVEGIKQTKELIIQLNKASDSDNIQALEKLINEIKGLTRATTAAASRGGDTVIEMDRQRLGRVVSKFVSDALSN